VVTQVSRAVHRLEADASAFTGTVEKAFAFAKSAAHGASDQIGKDFASQFAGGLKEAKSAAKSSFAMLFTTRLHVFFQTP